MIQQWTGDSASYGPSQTATNVTVATVSGPFSIASKQYTATANNAVANLLYTTALNGLPAGIYTAVFNVEVISDDVIWPLFVASNTQRRDWTLPKGKHIVNIPFYYDGGTSKTIGIQTSNLPNSSVFQIQRHRIYKGAWNITTEQVFITDIGIPSSGQGYIGDQVVNYEPTVGSYIGYVCGVSGIPGTWGSFGMIS